MALEVELLKQLRDLGGLKDGNNNEQHQEVHLLHSTRLGDQDLRTPDDFESEKLGNSSQEASDGEVQCSEKNESKFSTST